MVDLHHALVTLFVGLVSGLLVSIPVGPVNITIVNEGTRRGFVWAFCISLGAVTMEVIYCSIGFAGFSELFDSKWMRATMELITFLLMAFLGAKFLLMHDMPLTNKTADRVEHRLRPHTAFMIGFVRVLGNPNVLLGWITLSATFVAHEWVQPVRLSKIICVSGVGVGALVWFFILSYLVSRAHGKFSPKTLLKMSHISGALLLIFAALIGIRIVTMLAHRS